MEGKEFDLLKKKQEGSEFQLKGAVVVKIR